MRGVLCVLFEGEEGQEDRHDGEGLGASGAGGEDDEVVGCDEECGDAGGLPAEDVAGEQVR